MTGHTLYLPVEIKVREFHSRLVLAAEALRRGWPVIIGRKLRQMSADFTPLPPSVVLAKSGLESELESIAAFKDRGHLYGVMDEEGLVSTDPDYHGRYRYPARVREAVDFSLLWGDSDRAALGVGPSDPKHVVTGNPRLDLWRNQAFGLYEAEVKRLRAEHGNFILVPSTFASGLVPEAELRRRVEKGFPGAQFEAVFARYKATAEHLRHALEGYRETLYHLGAAGIPIVFRPHPRDNIAALRERIGSPPNVAIVAKGPVTPWILASRGLVHLNCTTSLEAILLGRYVIQHRPGDTRPEWLNFGVRDAGEQIHNAEYLAPRLMDVLKGDSITVQGDQSEDVRPYAFLDRRPASAHILDKIEGMTRPGQASMRPLGAMDALKQGAKAFLAGSSREKFPPTSASEVTSALRRIVEGQGRRQRFECATVGENLFQLSPS